MKRERVQTAGSGNGAERTDLRDTVPGFALEDAGQHELAGRERGDTRNGQRFLVLDTLEQRGPGGRGEKGRVR